MNDCIFCRIAKGEIPSRKVYEDEELFAFHDINPVASTHVLVVPKKHISGPAEVGEADVALVGEMIRRAGLIAKDLKLPEGAYRLVFNNGTGAGQTVFHLHLHLLGGRKFSWPPG